MEAHMRWQKLDRHVRRPGAYERWMYGEGIPVYETIAGVSDPRELPRGDWPRIGGRGTFIQMLGLYQAQRGMYVVEIPGGKTLYPERHLYEAFILVMQGRGATEIWQEGGGKVTFEWGEGSAFALPLNAWHRLINGTKEPALVLAITTAPEVMNALHYPEFVFNCEHQFTEEFSGESNHFTRAESHRVGRNRLQWETNFIPDARTYATDRNDPLKKDMRQTKVWGGEAATFAMGKHWPNGHISQWPTGTYHAAHRHDPGAVIIALAGKGYSLLWSVEAGERPYERGNAGQVVRVDWGRYFIYTPPDNWYHQHFNTGATPARVLATHPGNDRSALVDFGAFKETPVLVREDEGGLLIPYEQEDPALRRMFEEELAKEGITYAMPSAAASKK
jgi:quercetin dioxygenase-like cupin family protein